MNVLLCLSVAVFVLCPGDVAGQLTGLPPTCPGYTFTFRCTVTGNMSGETRWRVGGNSECALQHSFSSITTCGPDSAFRARSRTGFGTTSATSFTSTLSGTALNGTLVECFGPARNVNPGNRVGSSRLSIIGPPTVPTLSCVKVSEDVSGAVNVTVNWTLSDGDSADFYLINITTNAPQTPYGGLVNITGSVTQHKLTGFMAGYEYNITIRGINCGSQEGNESEPLTLRPRVPAVVSHCNITITYDHPPDRLLFIKTTWDSMPDQVDPDAREMCLLPRTNITRYLIRFQNSSSVNAVNVSISECTAGRCSHTFEPPSDPPSSYDSVSVAAVNVVGVGAARTCTTQSISTTNNFLTGAILDVQSPRDAPFNCRFLPGFNGSAHCTVKYGTDETYMNLPYSAVSMEIGTAGIDSVSVVLREQLNSTTEYYFTVSAVSGDVTVVMQGTFTTPPYSCFMAELWNLPAAGAALLSNVSLLDDAARYPSCVDGNARSSVLVNTTLNTATVAYYIGNMTGFTACFVCDEGSGYALNTSTNERVCQRNITWSERPAVCVCSQSRLLEWHIVLIALGVVFLIAGGVFSAIILVCNCIRDFSGGPSTKVTQRRKKVQALLTCLQTLYTASKMKCWQCFGAIATIFWIIGVALWIYVWCVVSISTKNDICNPNWRSIRNGLIIAGCVSSALVLVLAIIQCLAILIAQCLARGAPHEQTREEHEYQEPPIPCG